MADSILTAPPTLAHAVDPHDPDYLIVGERRLKRLRGGDGNDPADPANGGGNGTPPAATPPAALPNGPDGTPFDPDRALRALRQARDGERQARDAERTVRGELETANGRVTELTSQVETLQRQVQEAGGTSTEDAEAAQRRETELQTRETAAQDALRQARLLTELAKPEHGIVDAQAAAQLIEGVQYDDDGNPTNLTVKDGENPESKSLLDGFLEARPFLRSGAAPPPVVPSIDGGAGNGQQPVVDLTAEELEAADKAGLSPQQYQARKGVRTLKDWQATRAQESAAATQ